MKRTPKKSRQQDSVSRNRTSKSNSEPGRRSRRCPRLVLDANCTTCGRIPSRTKSLSVPELALRHVASTGHIVVLNGTADLPENH